MVFLFFHFWLSHVIDGERGKLWAGVKPLMFPYHFIIQRIARLPFCKKISSNTYFSISSNTCFSISFNTCFSESPFVLICSSVKRMTSALSPKSFRCRRFFSSKSYHYHTSLKGETRRKGKMSLLFNAIQACKWFPLFSFSPLPTGWDDISFNWERIVELLSRPTEWGGRRQRLERIPWIINGQCREGSPFLSGTWDTKVSFGGWRRQMDTQSWGWRSRKVIRRELTGGNTDLLFFWRELLNECVYKVKSVVRARQGDNIERDVERCWETRKQEKILRKIKQTGREGRILHIWESICLCHHFILTSEGSLLRNEFL